jgi:hypothetical protein
VIPPAILIAIVTLHPVVRAESLVVRLGDPTYLVRERAARELLEIGYPARAAVLTGQQSPDTEISDRCKKLYPAIWRHDLDKRVQKFLDKPNAPIPDDLPGAARWLKVAGDGRQSRELYAEMVKAHSELLLEVEVHPERLRDVYIEFVLSVNSRNFTRGPAATRAAPTESEVTLFFFLGAAGGVRPTVVPRGTSSAQYSQFLNAPTLIAQLASAPMRKVYAAWLEKERYSILVRRGIDLAARNGVKECFPAALKIAGDPGTIPTVRATALLGMSRLGTKENIKDLEPFFKDQLQITAVAVNGERWPVQMRDIALGAAVQLGGQELSDFGFERKPPTGLAMMSSYVYYAFPSDEKREAAHKKWREWSAANLRK